MSVPNQGPFRTELVTAALEGASSGARQTVQKRVLQRIRAAILNGHLTGGTRLVQSELAQILNVSTTPVREALRHLEAEGLVDIDAYRGGRVRSLSREELEEIYAFRAIIEPEALRRAMPIPKDVLETAERIHQRMQSVEGSAEFAILNKEFHLAIYSAGSPRLVKIIGMLMDPAMAYVSASLRENEALLDRSLADHAEILEAVRRDDVDAAVAIQINHFTIPSEALDLD